MIFEKDGIRYTVTDTAMIDAFTAAGWTPVTVKAEPQQEKAVEKPIPQEETPQEKPVVSKPVAKRGRKKQPVR